MEINANKPINSRLLITLLIIMLLIMLSTSLKTCRTASTVRQLTKELTDIKEQNRNAAERQKIQAEIEGYKISKRMLYDNNAVVRTVKRPDDILMGYDSSIARLELKLAEMNVIDAVESIKTTKP